MIPQPVPATILYTTYVAKRTICMVKLSSKTLPNNHIATLEYISPNFALCLSSKMSRKRKSNQMNQSRNGPARSSRRQKKSRESDSASNMPPKQTHQPDDGSSPSSGRKRFPGFNFVKPVDPAQQWVVMDGYPWVQTNRLIPTWCPISRVGPTPLPAAISQFPIDRLNRHGHHGLNTHLILKGDLTLERIKYSDYERAPVDRIRISADGPLREAAVGAGDIYLGTTERGCEFVEGHRCLSPTTALRFFDRGTIRWFDQDGVAAPMADQTFIATQLRKGPEFGKRDGALVFEVPGVSHLRRHDRVRLAAELKTWFEAEWIGDDLERMPSMPVGEDSDHSMM